MTSKTLPDLARAAQEALADNSGAKQSIGMKARVYVPQLSDEERAAHAAKLNARKASMALVMRRPLSQGNRVLRTYGLLWNREDQKGESPGS